MPAKGHKPSTDSTQAGLAKRLHVTRAALSAWSNLDGAPLGWDYDEWRAFMKDQSLGVSGNRTSADKEELQKEKLRGEIRLNELKIAKEERTSVSRADVDALLLHIATMQRTVLYPALERELPPRAEGRTAAEIGLVGREIADRLCDIFAASVESWKTQ
jgi:hypothetical protein